MLCRNCVYRQQVISTEIGTVYDRCERLNYIEIRKLGNVTQCSTYEAKDMPYLFVKTAWTMDKDKKGQWIFIDPKKT